MNTAEIIVIVFVACILAADIAVRLIVAPHNRDRLVESLLRHFAQSSLSCRIVDILAASDTGMREADIRSAVNAELIEKRRQALPQSGCLPKPARSERPATPLRSAATAQRRPRILA